MKIHCCLFYNKFPFLCSYFQKLKTRREKIEHLVQTLDENATPTTFDKICYYLEKEFLDVIADEMQVRSI